MFGAIFTSKIGLGYFAPPDAMGHGTNPDLLPINQEDIVEVLRSAL